MSDSNSSNSYRFLVPTEAQYFVLSGEPIPQLFTVDVSCECLDVTTLLQPQQINPPTQISSNTESYTVINSTSEVLQQVLPKAEPQLLSNIITPQNFKTQSSLTDVVGITAEHKNDGIEKKEKTKAVRNSKRIQTRQKKNETVNIRKEKENKVSKSIDFYFHIADREIPPRALAVLPTALKFREGHIFAHRPLPPRTRFGPVEGSIYKIFPCEADELVLEASVAQKPVFLMRRDAESVTHINVSDKERSNWISLLPLGNATTANVWLYEQDNELYGITTKIIPLRTPLVLGYSRKYSEDHKLPGGQPVLDLEKALSEHGNEWWCFECRRAFVSATILQRHVSAYHRDKPARQTYRCAFCSKVFRRIRSLRIHTAWRCKNKQTKLEETSIKTEATDAKDLKLMISKSTEENHTPLDESFHIYTSGFDISTNLFDPDKIVNLDIPGSSKSEVDFNSYPGALKFDDLDSNDDYKSFSEGLRMEEDNKDNSKTDELIIVSCPHCGRTMTKAKKRRHLRECSSRKWICSCERAFRRKEDLAQHVFTQHNGRNDITNKQSSLDEDIGREEDSKNLQYSCDQCKTKFKRRGMLVNHMWRVHGARAAVPLVRRVRHYPCGACPNLYLSACKRDNHVRKHHPGMNIRAAPIEGEKKTYEVAKCLVCPRQYSTRAKLYQHVRAAHSRCYKQLQTSPRSLLKKENSSKPPTIRLPRTGIL